ncbi:hypothetical protein HMPREF9163_00305 [Selenomonas sp. oral taxon 138 str. F0429]|nr:hypothetical protein HMPREF9163_00305 [Selenomonas sp. oral taxon 138 str. F0429]
MNRVFEDLEFSSLGEPLKSGNFYFTKGISKNFVYSNLSAGEKAAFDLILDLVIHSRYYPDTIQMQYIVLMNLRHICIQYCRGECYMSYMHWYRESLNCGFQRIQSGCYKQLKNSKKYIQAL